MARMPQAMAARVQGYAAAHRQPISVVIRDALLLLMDEYPSSADLSTPHRIAAHEFLSDRYDASLDMLLGEADRAALETLLSDTHEEMIDTMLEGTNTRPDMVSDTNLDDTPILSDRKEAQPSIVSAKHTDTPNPRAMTPSSRQSAKVSGTKADIPSFLSDTTGGNRPPDGQEVLPSMMSDRKAAKPESTRVSVMMSDTQVPAFDTTTYVLGQLCPRGHDYHGTGQSLRHRRRHGCLACDAAQARARRKARGKT